MIFNRRWANHQISFHQFLLDDQTFLTYYSSHLQRRGTCAEGERRSERGLRLRSRHMHSTSSHSDSLQGITNAICRRYRMYGCKIWWPLDSKKPNQTNNRQDGYVNHFQRTFDKHCTSCARGDERDTSEGSSRMTRRCIKCASISGPRLARKVHALS